MRPRQAIEPVKTEQLRVTASLGRGDAELLVSVIAQRGANGQDIHSFEEWVRYHARRDADSLGLSLAHREAARVRRALGVCSERPRDALGRFIRSVR